MIEREAVGRAPLAPRPVAYFVLREADFAQALDAANEGCLRHVAEPRHRFDLAVLLVKALVRADEIPIGQCFSCRSVLVTERLARGEQYCAVCRASQLAAKEQKQTQMAAEPVVLEPRFEQQSLF